MQVIAMKKTFHKKFILLNKLNKMMNAFESKPSCDVEINSFHPRKYFIYNKSFI